MKARVHIFGDDLYWQGAVERYIDAWFGGKVDPVIYSYRELSSGMNKDDFNFDAAIADVVDATRSRMRDVSIRCSGLDLYRGAPGKVVLATALWRRPPPISWVACVPLPMRDARALFVAVRAALRGEAGAPAAEQIEQYLAIPPVGTEHVGRSQGVWQ